MTRACPSFLLMYASQIVNNTTGWTLTEFSVTPAGRVSGAGPAIVVFYKIKMEF